MTPRPLRGVDGAANSQFEDDWTPTRPADMQPLIEDPIFEAHVVLIVCQKNLEIRMAELQRAERIIVRAIEMAQRAQGNANDAIRLVQEALWDLAEARG